MGLNVRLVVRRLDLWLRTERTRSERTRSERTRSQWAVSLDLVLWACRLCPTFVLLLFGRSRADSDQLDRVRGRNLPSPTSILQQRVRCSRAVRRMADASKGVLRSIHGSLAEREPPLAGARVGGVDHRALRVPRCRLGLCLRRRRRESRRARVPGSSDPRRSHLTLRRHARRPLPRASACSLITNIVPRRFRAGVGSRLSSSTPVRGSSTACRSPPTIATTPFRSAQAALTPSLARTPNELTAANAVASGVESIAVFAGPALAGVLLAVASTGVVFTATAALVAISALFVLLIQVERDDRPPRRELAASTIAAEATCRVHDARATTRRCE